MSQGPRTRVVVVDDNQPVASTIKAVIDSTDDLVTVGVAEDGPGGLAMCTALMPDIAVLDIKMPGGGPGLVRSLAEALPDLRLVVFSGQQDDGVVLDMMEAGTLAYVAKGTSIEELLRAIRRAAEGKRTVSDSVAPMVSRWMYGRKQ